LLGLATAGLALALVSVWSGGSSPELGKTVLTVTVFALAAAQTAALAARRQSGDPASLSALFAVSCVLALTLAMMASLAAWAELGDAVYFGSSGRSPSSTCSSSSFSR
jgi:hypothetical protein